MMPETPASPLDDDAFDEERGWEWRRCRDFGIEFHIWPLSWQMFREVRSDEHCKVYTFHLGPFTLQLNFNVGWSND